jgi:hypothetical protein
MHCCLIAILPASIADHQLFFWRYPTTKAVLRIEFKSILALANHQSVGYHQIKDVLLLDCRPARIHSIPPVVFLAKFST